ncbi:ABC transporter ATP-binding protein [Geitlerinema calcuttense]|uniref:ABC transporter ATP-binding protein n=1 Tax=Geitlerinema calcuttense NRMC-F 0142 TaxID=2922238 RepID=A0ABT7LX05_9CYAN|nr:ABC transporter ATP-binding protein [Geitlerinema calcuttense]MDL5056309.1 ABC transporter ATP-binding protein [Geitlerinema calcuttense NRMC-F 0142]
MILLKASHLHKSYQEKGRQFTAVRDVSLEVKAGEVLAFLGPNGAGKTTTIKMIAGLIYPDGGWVRIGDRDPHRDSKALRLLGAVLEGNRNVYWRLSPQENLEYFGVLRGLAPKVARQRARALLERFHLLDKQNTRVDHLSRGMQQKLAIAVALIHQPQLLLLDEPTLGLDVEATEDIKRLVREIAQEGCGIILTTHQLAIAEELSDRVAIINQGEIVAEEPTSELIRQFSGQSYHIELETPLDPQRQGQLVALGVECLTAQTLRVLQAESLYPVLEILKPLALMRVEKEQASLTDIFLKLVRENRNV